MRKSALSIIVTFVFLVTSCKKSEQNLLVGKWDYIADNLLVTKISTNTVVKDTTLLYDPGDFIDFMSNGQAGAFVQGESSVMPYKLLDDNKINLDGEVSTIKLLTKTDLKILFEEKALNDTLTQRIAILKRSN